jgi:hypothetical protein
VAPSGAKKPPGKLVAIYDYLDADCTLLHQTLRYAPKGFRQRRPAVEGLRQGDRTASRDRDGKWWIWTVDGIEPVLYRLPELLAAPESLPVFLCEGEKDADRLASAPGAVTTTAPMGAGKWRESYTQTLRGRDVVIIPDRDPVDSMEAGQKHAERVAQKLSRGGVKSIRIVDWNEVWPEAAQDESRKLDVDEFFEKLENEMSNGLKQLSVPEAAIQQLLRAAWDYVAPRLSTAPDDPRPCIRLPGHGRTLSEFAAELGTLLRDTSIFNHGGVVMVLNKERKKLEPVGQSFFRSWLEDHVQPQGLVGSSENARLENQSLTEDGAKGVLASPQFISKLLTVRRVNTIRQPMRRSDKTVVLLQPGYDEQSQIFTLESVRFDTEMSIGDAVAVFQKWFQDAAFNPNDRFRSESVAMAMMLAPFCDCMFSAYIQRPVFIVSANTEGAGKTTLVMMAVAPVFGPTKITAPPDSGHKDKLTELLNAVVQAGWPYVVFDNWRGKIESQALEAFITASTVSGRILCTSSTFEAEKQCLLFITSNDAFGGGDMRRRALFIELFVEEARAEDRKIKREISEKDILEGRGEILAALWAYVRNWSDRGCKDGNRKHQAFPEWGRVIGGILEEVGYPSPLLPPPESMDPRLEGFSKIVANASEEMEETRELFVSPSELLETARKVGAFHWFLDATAEFLSDKEKRSERTAFARQCDHFKGRVFPNGIRFDSIGEGHSKRYRFSKTEPDDQAE